MSVGPDGIAWAPDILYVWHGDDRLGPMVVKVGVRGDVLCAYNPVRDECVAMAFRWNPEEPDSESRGRAAAEEFSRGLQDPPPCVVFVHGLENQVAISLASAMGEHRLFEFFAEGSSIVIQPTDALWEALAPIDRSRFWIRRI